MPVMFGTRFKMAEDFRAWADAVGVSDCPESVILWLDMYGYLFDPRIMLDYNPEAMQSATQCCAIMNPYNTFMEQQYRELRYRTMMEGVKNDI